MSNLIDSLECKIETDDKLRDALREYFWHTWYEGTPHKDDVADDIPQDMLEQLLSDLIIATDVYGEWEIDYKYLTKR